YAEYARITSRTSGPNPSRYGLSFPVRLMSRSVRPWNAVLNETSHARFVAAREILTAFSIASDPELRKIDFVRPGGQISAMRAARSVYGPYVATTQELCVSRSSPSFGAGEAEGGRWPPLWTTVPT